MGGYYDFRPYVPVATRKAQAKKLAKKMAGKGQPLSPVEISGRAICKSVWGKAWCEHLESFSDFENRLPRGRTYARNGSIIDLKINKQQVKAMVAGSEPYNIDVGIKPLDKKKWKKIRNACAGNVDSMVDLLQGRLTDSVMQVITDRNHGLFPKPNEIELDCDCPDWAVMCKHVAAALYGVGARLDDEPELLFKLRGVDHHELIDESIENASFEGESDGDEIAADALSGIFGIELESENEVPEKTKPTKKKVSKHAKPKIKKAKKKVTRKKVSLKKTPVKTPTIPVKKKSAKAGAKKNLTKTVCKKKVKKVATKKKLAVKKAIRKRARKSQVTIS